MVLWEEKSHLAEKKADTKPQQTGGHARPRERKSLNYVLEGVQWLEQFEAILPILKDLDAPISPSTPHSHPCQASYFTSPPGPYSNGDLIIVSLQQYLPLNPVAALAGTEAALLTSSGSGPHFCSPSRQMKNMSFFFFFCLLAMSSWGAVQTQKEGNWTHRTGVLFLSLGRQSG